MNWQPVRKQSGTVLVTALLILLVLTLLGLFSLESGVLETKMSRNFRDQAMAFQRAESELRTKENLLVSAAKQGNIMPNLSGVEYDKQLSDHCIRYYRVKASGVYVQAQSELESIYAIPNKAEELCGPNKQLGRISWQQIIDVS